MVGAHQVQGHEGQPVDGVDAVGEEDEPGLVEPTWALPCFESIQGGRDYQQEGEEKARHEARIHTYTTHLYFAKHKS